MPKKAKAAPAAGKPQMAGTSKSGAKKAPPKKPAVEKAQAKKVGTKKITAKKITAKKVVAGKLSKVAALPAKLARVLASADAVDATVLDRLAATVLSRRSADPSVSHSARLMSRGTAKVAQKFGEEAVECLIEAVSGDHDALVAESADVLYHLVVLWVNAGVAPDEVWQELHRREGVSGIAEKARRKIALPTTKIP